MGRFIFKLPDIGEGAAEAEIVAWRVNVGQQVEEDQPLVDVMTEKATVELTAPVSGRIVELNGVPGDQAAVGSAIVVFEVEGAGNASASDSATHAAVHRQADSNDKSKADAAILRQAQDEGQDQASSSIPQPSPHPEPVEGRGDAPPAPQPAATASVSEGKGRYVFKLPDVGEGTAEAEVTGWHVKVGDHVNEDQPLVDVMTEKATVELTSPVSGRVIELNGEIGAMAPVGSPIVVLEVDGAGNAPASATPAPAATPTTATRSPSPKGEEKKEQAAPALLSSPSGEGDRAQRGGGGKPQAQSSAVPSGRAQGGGGGLVPAFATRTAGEKPLASPAVRKRAHDLGVNLQYVPGSGPAGRISHEDLDAYVASGGRLAHPAASGGAPSRYVEQQGTTEVRIIGLRRKIAEKMAESKRRIPHFGYVEEVDVTDLEALRIYMNATKKPDQPKLTLLPFIMRALVRILPDYPQINARYDDEAGVVTRYDAAHIGMATQTPNGLIVPVIRHAEARDIWGIAAEISRIAKATREGTATREELSGSTITVTSLGPLGGVSHFPVINHPEVGIIGPNKIIEKPVVKDGQIVVRKMMNISSSFDHRVVDGWDAAEFIQKIKLMLEHPATVFMD